jgi:hypothetical protein
VISPQLTMAMAQGKADDLRRAADTRGLAHLRTQPARHVAAQRSVTLRFGTPADRRPLARLAELDSVPAPEQPVLLAELDGQLRAALTLRGGAVIADPFHPTADLIDLLRARANQLQAGPRIRRCRRLRCRWRLHAPAQR